MRARVGVMYVGGKQTSDVIKIGVIVFARVFGMHRQDGYAVEYRLKA